MEQARAWLKSASRIVAFTGAGISAESGVPTFRGQDGLWKHYRAEQLATPEAFARDPWLVWDWYSWRRKLIAGTQPNPGHRALAELERRTADFTLITQNVDGLHDRAGSRHVLKLHGDIWQLRCVKCGREERDDRLEFPELPPLCACGGMLRPGVVWFGELLPHDVWRAAELAMSTAEAVLVAGTSAVVYPAAGLIPLARSSGAKIIEVNVEETPFSTPGHCTIPGTAGDVLPGIIA